MSWSTVAAPRPTRLVAASLLLFVALLATVLASPKDAEARGVWCSGDPAIVVNGSVVSITAHVPLDRLRDVERVQFVFHVPSNANVTAVINDSLLFKAEIVVQKDLPPAYGLLGTPVKVDMSVKHRGAAFRIAATTVTTGWGTRVWVDGWSSSGLRIDANGLLNLRLF